MGKKKKVETPKPWGRKERILILFFLLTIPILSTLFLLRHSPVQKDSNQVKNAIAEELSEKEGTYGVVFQSLDNSFNITINGTTQFENLDILKLLLKITYLQAVDREDIDPNSIYRIKYSDKTSGGLIPGSTISYSDLIANEDDNNFQIMANILGKSKLEKTIRDFGMTNTSFQDNLTTPEDISILFSKLKNSNYKNLISSFGKDYIFIFLSKGVDSGTAQIENQKINKIVYDWFSK